MSTNQDICGWTYVLSHDIRPTTTTFGATVTPGNNTYGSYATVLGTPLASDAYGIEIWVNGIGVSANVTDSLTTIGIDPAGGTSYSDFISHLLTSAAGSGATSGWYYFFPVKIPAGSTIGAKGTINNATVGTQSVAVKLYTKPTNPKLIPRVGTYVTTIGAVTATSTGTAVTAGTASIGTYTSLGTFSGNKLFHWTVAAACTNDSTLISGGLRTDLACGDGTTKKLLVSQQNTLINANEIMGGFMRGEYGTATSSDTIYARCWAASTDTAMGVIAYGVGG